MYSALKKLLPKGFRKFFKPLYLALVARGFTKPVCVYTKDGFSIWLDPHNGAVDEYMYIHKNWEPQIARLIKDNVATGDVFLDIGANIGYMSLLACAQGARVIAYEPIPRLVEQLQKSARENNFDITTRPVALGSEVMDTTISVFPKNVGGSSLVRETNTKIPISISTLDTEGVPKVDFIKIDTEGYEWGVLKGAEATIDTHKPNVVFEFSPRRYLDKTKTILSFFVEKGYTLFDIDRNMAIENIDTYLAITDTDETNIFASYTHV